MFVDLKNTSKYINGSDLISSYLKEIRKYQVLTSDEEQKAFEEIKKGNNEARDKVIQSNQRFVFAVSKRYAANEANLLDIINEANIGLIKAIDSFDETLGHKFITYAVWFMIREINVFLNNNENMIQKTNGSRINKILLKIKNEFFIKNGYYPSIGDIKAILNAKYNCKIKDNRDLYDLNINSIDANMNDDDDSITINDSLDYNKRSSSHNTYENSINNEYNKALVNDLLKDLPERDETVIKLLYGIDCERSYEINEVSQIVGITSERVRQIKIESIENFRKKIKYKKIAV